MEAQRVHHPSILQTIDNFYSSFQAFANNGSLLKFRQRCHHSQGCVSGWGSYVILHSD